MMIAPARRSTPTKALELINNLQPLEIYLHNLSIQAYKRHKSEYKLDWTGLNAKHPKYIGHRYFWANLSYKLIFGLEATDEIAKTKSEKKYHLIIQDEEGRKKPKLSQICLLYTSPSPRD